MSLYITYYAVIQRLYFHSRSKNVSAHAFLFEKCAYTNIFIRKLALHIHFYFHDFLFLITPTELQKKYSEASKCYCEASLTYIEMKLQSNFSDETKLQLKSND